MLSGVRMVDKLNHLKWSIASTYKYVESEAKGSIYSILLDKKDKNGKETNFNEKVRVLRKLLDLDGYSDLQELNSSYSYLKLELNNVSYLFLLAKTENIIADNDREELDKLLVGCIGSSKPTAVVSWGFYSTSGEEKYLNLDIFKSGTKRLSRIISIESLINGYNQYVSNRDIAYSTSQEIIFLCEFRKSLITQVVEYM